MGTIKKYNDRNDNIDNYYNDNDIYIYINNGDEWLSFYICTLKL